MLLRDLRRAGGLLLLAAVLLAAGARSAVAEIKGISGTVFTLTLPLVAAAVAEDPA